MAVLIIATFFSSIDSSIRFIGFAARITVSGRATPGGGRAAEGRETAWGGASAGVRATTAGRATAGGGAAAG